MEDRRGLASFASAHNEGYRENIVSDITQLVGWTPLIELKNIAKKEAVDARLIAKMESYQPLSSVKDRAALRMMEDAEEKGLIKPGITKLVEGTSGNLGISLAYIAARKGYKFIGVMPAHFSLDKRMLLRYLGADVSITGPEIWKDTGGKVDILVCGTGSGGTLTGTGKYLKMKNPGIKIICVEPAESAVLSGGQPGPHNIQGMGPGFVPKNVDMSHVDEIITVTTEEAMVHARRIAREEGLLVGISSGANITACLKVAKRVENKDKMIVTMFSSGGERYISTQLFDEARDECANMCFS
ncbi:bifunctional cystathionine gamma-lyase/cysteine synthase-like isoform X2 [Asparagus officinalis]|uniref:bifunctional cystathionine gamma-lyase/cysteine synthase-like isoform X2 n=1 Tax=Asparagus officinalis TaxID=4686 RepID=UPI00098E7C52|nr:bifunctional cystathionine gamma-lyase/cysteine synthase-like isoform X2 [Asparagus officinalis]